MDSILLSKEVWKGSVPIQFSLFVGDLCADIAPEPFFVMLPRASSLFRETKGLIDHFYQYSVCRGALESELWFSSADGKALKSNMPVGLLFDSDCDCRASSGIYDNDDVNEKKIPWCILVHFQNYPYQKIIKCTSLEESQSLFFHSLKQSVFILFGNTRRYNELAIEQQDSLFTSALFGLREEYYFALKSVILDFNDLSEIRSLPIRIVLNGKKSNEQAGPTTTSRTRQVVIPTGEVSQKTLSDVFMDFENLTVSNVKIQGISVPLDSDIHNLWKIFHMPDLFLYVTCVCCSEN